MTMLTPDEWAAGVLEKIRQQASCKRIPAATVTYDGFDDEMGELWLRTKVVFDEYIKALGRRGVALNCNPDSSWFEITIADARNNIALLVHFSSHAMFDGIELRLGDRTHRFPVRMTPSGLELLSEDEESRTSLEEVAANALEHLLSLGER